MYATTTGSASVTFRKGSFTGSMIGNITMITNNSYNNQTMTGSGWNVNLFSGDLVFYIVDANTNNINNVSLFLDIVTQ